MRSRAKATQKQILILVFLTMIGLALACRAADAPAPSNPTPSPTTSDSDEQRLTKAQVKYFEAQTSKGDSSSFSWTGLFTVSGAVIAAMVALLSLYVNNRTAIRNQRDTQFFEALKRFGDQDSATVRASAAATIALLGNEKVIRWTKQQGRTFPHRKSVLLYFETAVHQLITGLMLEENPVTLTAITDAAEKLVQIDSHLILGSVHRANIALQKDLIAALAEFYAAQGCKDPWSVNISQAALVTDYKEEVISKILFRYFFEFDSELEIAVQFLGFSEVDTSAARVSKEGEAENNEPPSRHTLAVQSNPTESKLTNVMGHLLRFWESSRVKHPTIDSSPREDERTEKVKALTETRHKLFVSATRLRANVKVYSAALRADPFRDIHRELDNDFSKWDTSDVKGMNLRQAFLVGAQLENTRLDGANLQEAQLQLADLESSQLRMATLTGAQLQGANLLFADLKYAKVNGADLGPFEFKTSGGETSYVKKTDLSHAEFQRANLSYSSFKKADLTYAKLQGASVTNSSMSATQLYEAEFDDKTDLNQTDWWHANFFERDGQKIHIELLEMLYQKYQSKLPTDLQHLHPSVRQFVNEKQKPQTAEQAGSQRSQAETI